MPARVLTMYSPFRHLGLKIVAVALAALLWLIGAGDHLVERSMRVPLEFRNIPNELEIVGDPPTSVDVRLRGSSAQLARLEPSEVVAVLDLVIWVLTDRVAHVPSLAYRLDMVEDGRIARPITNLRFTQSFLEALGPGAVRGASREQALVLAGWDSIYLVPTLRLASWNFTGGAKG